MLLKLLNNGISILPFYICVDAIKEGKLEIKNLPKSANNI